MRSTRCPELTCFEPFDLQKLVDHERCRSQCWLNGVIGDKLRPSLCAAEGDERLRGVDACDPGAGEPATNVANALRCPLDNVEPIETRIVNLTVSVLPN